jgi:hypothetical protein
MQQPRQIILYINSINRVSGTVSNFNIVFKDNLIKANNGEIIKLTLNDFVTNFSFYAIQYYNNTFRVTETDGASHTFTQDISIPPGNYTITNLNTQIENQLNLSPFYSYVLTRNSTFNKTTFTYTLKPTVLNGTVKFDFTPITFIESAHQALGFTRAVFNFIPNILGGQLTSNAVCNVNAEENLFLRCNGLISDNLEFVGTEFCPANILAKIAITAVPFSKISFLNIRDNFSAFTKVNAITSMNFSITNENGIELDLNGQEFNFSMLVQFLPTVTRTDTIISKFDRVISLVTRIHEIIEAKFLTKA